MEKCRESVERDRAASKIEYLLEKAFEIKRVASISNGSLNQDFDFHYKRPSEDFAHKQFQPSAPNLNIESSPPPSPLQQCQNYPNFLNSLLLSTFTSNLSSPSMFSSSNNYNNNKSRTNLPSTPSDLNLKQLQRQHHQQQLQQQQQQQQEKEASAHSMLSFDELLYSSPTYCQNYFFNHNNIINNNNNNNNNCNNQNNINLNQNLNTLINQHSTLTSSLSASTPLKSISSQQHFYNNNNSHDHHQLRHQQHPQQNQQQTSQIKKSRHIKLSSLNYPNLLHQIDQQKGQERDGELSQNKTPNQNQNQNQKQNQHQQQQQQQDSNSNNLVDNLEKDVQKLTTNNKTESYPNNNPGAGSYSSVADSEEEKQKLQEQQLQLQQQQQHRQQLQAQNRIQLTTTHNMSSPNSDQNGRHHHHHQHQNHFGGNLSNPFKPCLCFGLKYECHKESLKF